MDGCRNHTRKATPLPATRTSEEPVTPTDEAEKRVREHVEMCERGNFGLVGVTTSDLRLLLAALDESRKDGDKRGKLLRALVEEFAEYQNEDGIPDVPGHACDYTRAPDTGHCQFHSDWADALKAAGYFDD